MFSKPNSLAWTGAEIFWSAQMNMSPQSLPSLRRRGVALLTAMFTISFLLLMIGMYTDQGIMEFSPVSVQQKSTNEVQNGTLSLPHRKLLGQAPESQDLEGLEPNRIWSDKCSKSDIVINQGASAPLPSGIPTYTVEIMNVCASGCDISGIHLSCGWFSSARLINPHVFKRLRFNDCLVNDGKPLVNGRTLSFQYANTFRYPLAIASISC